MWWSLLALVPGAETVVTAAGAVIVLAILRLLSMCNSGQSRDAMVWICAVVLATTGLYEGLRGLRDYRDATLEQVTKTAEHMQCLRDANTPVFKLKSTQESCAYAKYVHSTQPWERALTKVTGRLLTVHSISEWLLTHIPHVVAALLVTSLVLSKLQRGGKTYYERKRKGKAEKLIHAE